MPLLDHVQFTFACETRYGVDDTMIYGTGGQILGELRRLLADVRQLRFLSISHLLLDVSDAATLLDDVAVNSRHTLKSLQLLNITRSTSPSLRPYKCCQAQQRAGCCHLANYDPIARSTPRPGELLFLVVTARHSKGLPHLWSDRVRSMG